MSKKNLPTDSLPDDLRALFADTQTVDEANEALRREPLGLSTDPEFQLDYLKARFVEDVLAAMEEQGLNASDLARRLGRSRQYVSAFLNEKSNFTFESVARIAAAFGMQPAIRMARPGERVTTLPVNPKPSVLPLAHAKWVQTTCPQQPALAETAHDGQDLAA